MMSDKYGRKTRGKWRFEQCGYGIYLSGPSPGFSPPARPGPSRILRTISEQELTWDALSAHETEHGFEVRQSFRSVDSFRTVGIEQINIGKTGSIESRQIINQPRLTRGFITVAVTIAVVAVTGVIFGGLFAAGRPDATNVSQQLSTSISITPETPAILISPDGEVSIELNANTVGAPAQLAYSALYIAEIPALPPEFTSTDKSL